jgi:NADPH:quinone reductase-like Zn-dependent oxidoreductase
MKAIVQDSYGTSDVLKARDVDRPEVAAGEVLIHVKAAAVGRNVWHVMTGWPYPIRLAGYGLRSPKTPVPGMDVAGVVESVGAGVTRFAPGDEVFGVGKGAFAEFATAPESKLAPKPANVGFEAAAVIPICGLTGLQALRKGELKAGQRVLITGASGGVGTFAVQIAKAQGAEVTAVCSAAKVEMVRSLGAGRVVDYTHDDFADGDPNYDLILDIGGTPALSRLRRALSPTGTLVIAGGETGGHWLGGYDRQLRALVLSRFVGQKLTTVLCSENHEDLLVLKAMVEAGEITPELDRTFSLADAPEAMRYFEEGRARGKIAIGV